MTNSDPLILVAAASAAATSAGPLSQVFDETSLLIAIMGMAGGSLLAFKNKAPWREFIRPAAMGGLLAFGLGFLAISLINLVVPIDISADNYIEQLASAAFVVGFAQERVQAFMLSGKKLKDEVNE